MEIRPTRRASGSSLLTRAVLTAVAGGTLVLSTAGSAAAQGSCKGTARENTPVCDTTPAKLPFASMGLRTVAMDHFTLATADYKKEAAYYVTLMGWKLRSDDGQKAVLDAGDAGTVIIRGGYTAPPAQTFQRPAGADTTGRAGRGGGRGGPRAPVNALWDSFVWQVAPWDAKKIKAELEKRGLNPVEQNDGHGYQAFIVKDPDGFEVGLSNGYYAKQRMANRGKPGMSVENAPFAPTDWHTVWLDHISFAVTNYKESVAFYQAVLGWLPQGDEGSQNETWMCEDCGNILIRGGNPNDTSRPAPAVRRALINHISFGIQPFDADKTLADLKSRGQTGRPDTGTQKDIHDPTATYKSYHTPDAMGWDLQISNADKQNRTVR